VIRKRDQREQKSCKTHLQMLYLSYKHKPLIDCTKLLECFQEYEGCLSPAKTSSKSIKQCWWWLTSDRYSFLEKCKYSMFQKLIHIMYCYFFTQFYLQHRTIFEPISFMFNIQPISSTSTYDSCFPKWVLPIINYMKLLGPKEVPFWGHRKGFWLV